MGCDYPRSTPVNKAPQGCCGDACKKSEHRIDIWEELCMNIVQAAINAEHVLTDAEEIRTLLVGCSPGPSSPDRTTPEESKNIADRIRRATNRINVALRDIEEELHRIANGVESNK